MQADGTLPLFDKLLQSSAANKAKPRVVRTGPFEGGEPNQHNEQNDPRSPNIYGETIERCRVLQNLGRYVVGFPALALGKNELAQRPRAGVAHSIAAIWGVKWDANAHTKINDQRFGIFIDQHILKGYISMAYPFLLEMVQALQ